MATVEPAGNTSSRRNTPPGQACATSMRSVSAVGTTGLGAEIVDHAVGQALEAKLMAKPPSREASSKSSSRATLQPCSPTGVKVQVPSMRAQRAIDQLHVQAIGALRAVLRVVKLWRRPAKRKSSRASIHAIGHWRGAGAPTHQGKRFGYASTSLTRSNICSGE